MPLATALAASLASWRTVVIAGGALSALVAVLSLSVSAAGIEPRPTMSALAALKSLVRRPGFRWFGLLILLGGGNEASMAGWTASFLVTTGEGASTATWVLSSHWLGLILSRALLAGRVDRAKSATIERGAVLSAFFILILVLSTSRAVLLASPFVIGLAMALVMPTLLALAGERFPGHAGALFGGLLTLAQVGGMALPSSIGFVGERAGLRPALALLVGSYMTIALVVRRQSRPDDGAYPVSPKDG